MALSNDTYIEINTLISYLVEKGLADAQQHAILRASGTRTRHVSFSQSGFVNIALKNVSYGDIYEQLVESRAYNAKMLDGALIQLMYSFEAETVASHRLAFFPAPHLEEFQNNPDIYLDDEIYADVVDRNIVPFPVRFDYNIQTQGVDTTAHPISHLTLGQYRNCRIPVTGPVSPFRFIEFILRNFYHTAFSRYADALPAGGNTFADTIRPHERRIVHLVVPA